MTPSSAKTHLRSPRIVSTESASARNDWTSPSFQVTPSSAMPPKSARSIRATRRSRLSFVIRRTHHGRYPPGQVAHGHDNATGNKCLLSICVYRTGPPSERIPPLGVRVGKRLHAQQTLIRVDRIQQRGSIVACHSRAHDALLPGHVDHRESRRRVCRIVNRREVVGGVAVALPHANRAVPSVIVSAVSAQRARTLRRAAEAK